MADINAAANGFATAASHPLTVQVINQGPGIWGNVATGLITAGAAIAAVMLTHRFTLKREKQASEKKLNRERYFIATELVFLLERFAEECIPVACDAGTFDNEQGRLASTTVFPKFDYSGVTGDWQSLPPRLVYRLRELTVMQEESQRLIYLSFEWDDPMEPSDSFSIRQYQAARLGMKAKIQAEHLRRLCSMPAGARLHDQKTACAALWRLWRKHRNKEVGRLVTAKLLREFAEEHQREHG